MGINIKRESTQRMARELAEITGESITSAIEVALAERLDRLRLGDDAVAARLARMKAITADSARRWPAGPTASELIDELYDDDGLPA